MFDKLRIIFKRTRMITSDPVILSDHLKGSWFYDHGHGVYLWMAYSAEQQVLHKVAVGHPKATICTTGGEP